MKAMGKATVKRYTVLACCLVCCWICSHMQESYAFAVTSTARRRPPAFASTTPYTPGSLGICTRRSLPRHERYTNRNACGQEAAVSMTAANNTHRDNKWSASLAAAAAALSVLVSVIAPVGAEQLVNAVPEREPLVQALVQLPDEESDWTRLLPDVGQASGANMLISASQEKVGGRPTLGATVAMDKVKFPVMLQLFPTNAVGGATWPGDFDAQGSYDVEVAICGGGESRGVVCKSPSLTGSGQSLFVAELEDVPEIAEGGGALVPATVVLEPASKNR